MLPRLMSFNRNVILIAFCLIFYTCLRGAFLSYRFSQDNDLKLRRLIRNESLLSVTYPPSCPIDHIGVPSSLCPPQSSCLNITCRSLLFANVTDTSPTSAFKTAEQYVKLRTFKRISNQQYIEWTENCRNFTQQRGYITKPLTTEEENFPIAYNILIHKDVELFERLLRSIYHPQNTYCVHVDARQPEDFLNIIKRIVSCFPNVFIASKLEQVVYAGYSRLQADINCMKDHLSGKVKWKYLFNLAGQAFPLKTNLELVQILKIYNGVNDIEGILGPRVHRKRFEEECIEVDHKTLKKTKKKNPKPPHDIDIVRGSAYGVFSHDFVDYIINDPWAVDLLKWSERTYSPDEHYWATLHHTYSNPHIHPPGAYSGDPNKKPWLAVFAKWAGVDKCHGVWKRGVCVFGIGDLPELRTRHEMFANKFYLDIQPLALDCLEAWILHKTYCPRSIDVDYYSNLPYVRQRYSSWLSS